jgi:hypothetical protein
MTIHEASCCCGQLKVHAEGEPFRRSMCHCLACQRRTGSVYGVQVRYRTGQVSVTGESTQFIRIGDSGQRVIFHFCPRCGSTVWWIPESMPDCIAIAVGAFADPSWPPPRIAVYEAHRHPWAAVDAALPMEHHD